jgi:hypothetical protein
MPLFHIQDNDRPAYVKADSYGEAVDKWLKAGGSDNGVGYKKGASGECTGNY